MAIYTFILLLLGAGWIYYIYRVLKHKEEEARQA
jgi:hypothetical protein